MLCQNTFKKFKTHLCSVPVLAYPDFTKPFLLDTYASDTGIGAILSQLDENGRECVNAYASRLFSKPEWSYCVTRRELLARMPLELMHGGTPSEPMYTTTAEYGTHLKLTLQQAYKRVREETGQKLDRQKELYDQKVHGTPLARGNWYGYTQQLRERKQHRNSITHGQAHFES